MYYPINQRTRNNVDMQHRRVPTHKLPILAFQHYFVGRRSNGMADCKVGYTMRDIRYKWNEGPNSVGVSSEVSLPQFKVLGHRQRAMEISLTTGTCRRSPNFSLL